MKTTRFISSHKMEQYDVINKKGEDLGQVQTFVMDMQEGMIAFVLVAFGGILGISDKWFAMPWAALEWHPGTMKFILDMPEEVLKNAPGMDKDEWLEEIAKWEKERDTELLDRYYTTHGYESYEGIVQKKVTKIGKHIPDAKFEISKDTAGEFRFKLVATNGECIATSEGYVNKDGAMSGIDSVKRNAPEALIEDNTV